MTPLRAKQKSASVVGPSKEQPRKKSRSHPYSINPRQSAHKDTLPGLQKLKSAIRQTKRLLAKNNLAADVRVETGRRLKALEADLARAEQSRKERQYATKYHRVKFFERQKVIRKINQTKRKLANSEGKEKENTQSALTDLRVDLNYVLHFPKAQKYVSLFPPEVRGPGSAAEPVAASSDDNKERARVRGIMRQRMECGELSTEPENDTRKPDENKWLPSNPNRSTIAVSTKSHTLTDDIARDDFFGDDDEEDDEGENFQQSDVSDF